LLIASACFGPFDFPLLFLRFKKRLVGSWFLDIITLSFTMCLSIRFSLYLCYALLIFFFSFCAFVYGYASGKRRSEKAYCVFSNFRLMIFFFLRKRYKPIPFTTVLVSFPSFSNSGKTHKFKCFYLERRNNTIKNPKSLTKPTPAPLYNIK
jgi:hypothetical protein